MTWKQWAQLMTALVIAGMVLYVGVLILPEMVAMSPIFGVTAGVVVEAALLSVGVGIPAATYFVIKSLQRRGVIAEIEARKLLADQGYITPDNRILVAAAHIAEERVVADLAQKQLPSPRVQLPEAPTFREIMPYISGEQVVIAYNNNGVVLGKVLDWLSTLLVGRPGSGKSTALYFFIAQLMMLAAKFQVLDPHGTLISLKNMLPYINRTDGCIQSASAIEQELEERMDRYEANGGKCIDPHYMLIVDELPAIADREQQLMKAMDRREKGQFRSLIDVLRRVVCEGRKYKMYCMVVGQSIPASVLPTIARDNMSTRYVFNCSPAHAQMAGLDRASIDRYLPAIQGSIGKCIVAPSRMNAFLGAIPETGVEDLQYVIENTGYVPEGLETRENIDGNAVGEPVEWDEFHCGNTETLPENTDFEPETTVSEMGNAETLPEGVTEELLDRITAMYDAHWPLRSIAQMVKLTGRKYGTFRVACEYLGIAPKAEEA